jgi:hypothetical protein
MVLVGLSCQNLLYYLWQNYINNGNTNSNMDEKQRNKVEGVWCMMMMDKFWNLRLKKNLGQHDEWQIWTDTLTAYRHMVGGGIAPISLRLWSQISFLLLLVVVVGRHPWKNNWHYNCCILDFSFVKKLQQPTVTVSFYSRPWQWRLKMSNPWQHK